MNTFLTKLAMLVMFLLAVTCGWAALVMVFPVSLYNILLGILAAFFLLRAFELADKINKLGPYSDEDESQKNNMPPKPGPGPMPHGPRFGEGAPDSDEEDITPDEG
jgi:hypothetical protein